MASSSSVSDAAYVSSLLSQGVERLEEVREFAISLASDDATRWRRRGATTD